MTATLTRVIEFANSTGDRLRTRRVRLDASGPTYVMTMQWLPVADLGLGAWAFTMATTSGLNTTDRTVVSGAILRDRTDVLSNITSTQRPAGAIIVYSAAARQDPRRMAFERDGYRLLYLPGGFDPATFAISEM